jgi:hypothetical protein
MDAARPAARALLPFEKLLHRALDPLRPRLCLLGVFNPANELVPADGSQLLPKASDLLCLSQSSDQVSGHCVRKTA